MSRSTVLHRGTGATVGPLAHAEGVRISGPRGIAALALGATAVSALAIGAVAVGRLAIGRLTVRSLQAREVDIDVLRVGRIEVDGQTWTPGGPVDGR